MGPLEAELHKQVDTLWLWSATRLAVVRRSADAVQFVAHGLSDRMLLGFSEGQWMRLVSVLNALGQGQADGVAVALGLMRYASRAAYARSAGTGALLRWTPLPPSIAGWGALAIAPTAHRQLFSSGDGDPAPPSVAEIAAALDAQPWHFSRDVVQFQPRDAWNRTLTSAVYESLVAGIARTLKHMKMFEHVPGVFGASAVPHHRVAFAQMSIASATGETAESFQRYEHRVTVLARDLALDAVKYTVHPANTSFLFDHFYMSYVGVSTARAFAALAKCTAWVYQSALDYRAPHTWSTSQQAPERLVDSAGRLLPVYASTDLLDPDTSLRGTDDDEGGGSARVEPLIAPGGAEGPGCLGHFPPRARMPAEPGGSRRRIGYISAFFHDLHSVYRDRQGIIRGAPDQSWEVTLFAVQRPTQGCVVRMFDSADRVVVLSGVLAEAQRQVAACELDVLVYCDIGMYPLTYYLAFARLAPVQVNTWGHSDTSGIPTLDYFLSSRWFVGPEYPHGNPQCEFSERLILLDSLTTYYQPLYNAVSAHIPRSGFAPWVRVRGQRHVPFSPAGGGGGGLPADGPLLVCMQSLFKFSDTFLAVLVRILRRVPSAYLVILREGDPATSVDQRVFDARVDREVGKSEPDGDALLGRVLMLDRLQLVAYQSLLLYTDLFLDPHPFGGCNSTFEAFQHGQVVLTWPHATRLSGRFSVGLYRRMGIDDSTNPAVVDSADGYVEAVHRLCCTGRGRADMERLRERIRAKSSVLFAERASVDEWYKVLAALCGRSAPGSPPKKIP
jgi:hypothetical protein